VVQAIETTPQALQYAPEYLQDGGGLLNSAIDHCPYSYMYASDNVKQNQARVLYFLENVPEKELTLGLVMEMVKHCPMILNELSDQWKDHEQVIIAAVRRWGGALSYATERFRDDFNIVLTAVKSSRGEALEYASERLRDDPIIVSAAVKCGGRALQHASERFRDDPTTVSAAVKRGGWSLEYASERFRDDLNIAFAAFQSCGESLEHVSERLRDRVDVVLAACEQNHSAFRFASDKLRDDTDVVLAAIKVSDECFAYASERIRNDRDTVLAAVKINTSTLRNASDALKSDEEVVRTAVRKDGKAIVYASEELKSDVTMIALALGCIDIIRMEDVIDCDILKAMRKIVSAIILHEGPSSYIFNDMRTDSIRHYAEHVWKKRYYERFWLTQQSVPDEECARLVLEFLLGTNGLPGRSTLRDYIREQFALANEFVRLSPIFCAICSYGGSRSFLSVWDRRVLLFESILASYIDDDDDNDTQF